MCSKKLNISIVSLLACFAGQAVLAAQVTTSSITTKQDIHSANLHKHIIKISVATSQVTNQETYPTTITNNEVNRKDATHQIHQAQQRYRNSSKQAMSTKASAAASNASSTTDPNMLSNAALAQSQEFKLRPHLNLWGFTGDSTLAAGQLMLPLYGDQNRVFYGLAEGNLANQNNIWLAGGGAGYRQVINNRIYGGYAIMNYNSTPLRQGFWIANPGAEILGPVWDFNVSGYIPVGAKKLVKRDWADNFGVYDFVQFAGHNEYDHRLRLIEEVSRGLSVEVGRVIPKFDKAKIYLGAYHFGTQDAGTTNGVESRITYQLNKLTALNLVESYDNTNRNKLLAGVRITLGGYSDEEKKAFGISSRLLDPIEHNSALFNGSNFVPVKKTYIDEGIKATEHDNIWFFKPSATGGNTNPAPAIGDGTYENPLVGFTAGTYGKIANIGVIDPCPLMFFAPGTYSFQDFSSRSISNRFSLPNGWGMYGRTADYIQPAMGDERARFNGGLDLNYTMLSDGQAATTLNSIRVFSTVGGASSSDPSNATLYVENAANVILQNTSITNEVTVSGSDPSVTLSAYAFGMYADNSTLNFEKLNYVTDGQNSIIGAGTATNTVTGTGDGYAHGVGYGIYAGDNLTMNFAGGNNSIAGIGTATGIVTGTGTAQSIGFGYGIHAGDNLIINFAGGENNITGTGTGISTESSSITGGTSQSSDAAYGIYAGDSSTINFNGGTNSIVANGIEVANSDFNSNIGAVILGIYAGDNLTINFNGGANSIVANDTANATTTSNFNFNATTIYDAAYALITGSNSIITFNGGTNVITGAATANIVSTDTTGTGEANSTSYGVSIVVGNNSTMNFNGGENVITGTAAGNVAFANATSGDTGVAYDYAYGISVSDNSTMNFNGGENVITGTATANMTSTTSSAIDTALSANSWGINGSNSTINFNGGENVIAGTATANSTITGSGGGNSTGTGFGIQLSDSTINFTGGENSIEGNGTANATGAGVTIDGKGYGIYAQTGSTIIFSNPETSKVNITANGTTIQDGIYADSSSYIQQLVGGTPVDITDGNVIKNYVAFSTSDPTKGDAVWWDGTSYDHYPVSW